MNKKNFESLVKSVNEGGKILRGEIEPSREFRVQMSVLSPDKRKGFALCVKSSEPELLIPSKVYRAIYSSSGLIGVTDEAGDAAIYPADCFVKLDFPSEVENLLGHLQKAA